MPVGIPVRRAFEILILMQHFHRILREPRLNVHRRQRVQRWRGDLDPLQPHVRDDLTYCFAGERHNTVSTHITSHISCQCSSLSTQKRPTTKQEERQLIFEMIIRLCDLRRYTTHINNCSHHLFQKTNACIPLQKIPKEILKKNTEEKRLVIEREKASSGTGKN